MIKPALAIALLIAAAVAVPALAHKGASGVVKERMEVMKSLAGGMKALKKIVDGGAGDAAGHARRLHAHAAGLVGLFPEGSGHPPSEALPAVWRDRAAFAAAAAAYREASAALLAAAEAGDAAGLRKAFRAVGRTCSGCHKDFRKAK